MKEVVDMNELLKQRVEILAQELKELIETGGGGGGTTDAYTKAESDEKFLSKSDAVSNYQPKGNYATVAYVDEIVGNINTVLEEVL